MARFSGKNRFGGEIFSGDEDVNPMDGAANLADVMLVLACGLMLALIINWNVDVTPVTEQGDSLTPGVEITESIDGGSEQSDSDSDAELEELGTVYRDPTTGKLYMVENE
jgi:hypothetical protein